MKKIVCDKCNGENARSFTCSPGNKIVDLCLNCISEYVLTNKVKLKEATTEPSVAKKMIYG